VTRHDRPEGRPSEVGTSDDCTPDAPRVAFVRLHPQPADTSAELVDKAGDAYAHLVYIELAALLEPLRRLRCEVSK
jgi:hypothetical protein